MSWDPNLPPPPPPVPPAPPPPPMVPPLPGSPGAGGGNGPRPALTASLVILAVLVVAGLGIGGFLYLTDSDDDSAVPAPHAGDAPTEWDPAVVDIAEWVAEERGLEWVHPVPIRYLDEEAFVEELTADLDDPEDEEIVELEHTEALYQALGFIGEDVDLVEEITGVMGSGVLAYYDYETGEIVMRGSDMTPALRVTLAHELTHALQDQHFGLQWLFEESEVAGGGLTLRAVVEGDAGRVEDAYTATLPLDEQAAATDYGPEINEAVAGLDDIEDAILAVFMSPYILGPTFVELVDLAGGAEAVDGLFVPDIPEIALVAPMRFLEDMAVDVVDVEVPPLPDGAEAIDDPEPFGALGLHMMLSGRIDAFESLEAVDGWAGDSMQLYSLDGATCVAAAFRGTDPAASAAIEDAVRAWVAAGPAGHAEVSERGEDVILRSCSLPGAAGPTESITDAVVLIAARHGLYLAVGVDFLGPERAECVVNQIMAAPELRPVLRSIAENVAPSESQTQQLQLVAQEATTTCLAA